MQMRHIIVVIVGKCIREGRTIQSSVLSRILKFIYLLYFLNVSQNRVKSQWRNGSFHFHIHFCFIAKQRWKDGQTLIFKTHTYIERRRRRERKKEIMADYYKKPKVRSDQQGGMMSLGKRTKQNTRGRSIRMQLGFLTHIMFLNYCTLHTPNS